MASADQVRASGSSIPGHIVLVVADGLDWSILNGGQMPNLRRLASEGSLGLMNTRSPALKSPGSGHLTIGAGTRLAGDLAGGLTLEPGEESKQGSPATVLRRTTGGVIPSGGAGFIGLPQIYARNREAQYPFEIGALAGTLTQKGLSVGAVGNSDRPGDPFRPAASLAADSLGVVRLAKLAGLNAADADFPFGIRSDYRAYRRAIEELWPGTNLLVVELGDFSRLWHDGESALPHIKLEAIRRVAAAADRFIGDLAARMDPSHDLLIISVPTPRPESLDSFDLLSFCLFRGPGYGPGLLYSGSTRRPGLVANTDLAPTIISLFGLSIPQSMVGRPVSGGVRLSEEENFAWDYLFSFQEKAREVQGLRRPLLRSLIFLEILAAAVLLLGSVRSAATVARLFPVLLFLTALPLGLFLWPGWFMATPAALAVMLISLAGLAALAYCLERERPLDGLLLITGLTWAAIMADTLSGARLALVSPMSYSPSGGARYYGIGNEYAGVFIGSSLVFSGLLHDRFNGSLRLAAAMVPVFSVWLLVGPSLGANFGGAISAAVGYSVAFVGLGGLGSVKRSLVAVGAAGVLAGGTAVVLDLLAPEPSYLARALAMAVDQGLPALGQIAVRKISMNLRLIRYTNWTLLFLASMAAFIYLIGRPGGLFPGISANHSGLKAALAGLGIGSLAALILNDSGIVAAATVLIFAKAPLAALRLEEVKLGHSSANFVSEGPPEHHR